MRRERRRTGFTLIELLVVLAIIGVLVSLSAVAVFRLIGTQQNANTKSELSRVEAAFKKAYRSAADKYAKEPIPSNFQGIYTNILTQDANNDRLRAQVIWTKLRLQRAFPQSFNEALNPLNGNPLPPLSYYTTTLGQYGYTASNVIAPPATPAATSPESSICLLLALQRGEDGPGLQQTDLGPSAFFKSLPVQLTGGPPLQYGQPVTAMVDAWGNPIFYTRWPIHLNASVNTNNPNNYGLTGVPALGYHDADDPTGLLASTSWQGTGGFSWFKTNLHDLNPHPSGPPSTYLNFPVIASAGANGNLGYNPYTVGAANTPTQSIDADDLLATLAPPQ